MVPDSLQFLDRACSKHYGQCYTSQAEHRVHGVSETSTLLALFSAMLERNCPTKNGTTIYSGYGSRSSSSLRSASYTGSITSSRCGSAISQASSVAELPDQLPPLTDDHRSPDAAPSEMEFSFSPSNLDSLEAQTLCILTFAFIWSIGAYVPFRFMHSSLYNIWFNSHLPPFTVSWRLSMNLQWNRSMICPFLYPSLMKAASLITTWISRATSLSPGQIARDGWLPEATATSLHQR